MNALDIRVKMVVNNIEPEFRVPVVNALQASDGTLLSFQQELSAQVWDMPELPVQDIMDRVAFDVV
jgi:hypothetical protein